MVIFSVIVLSKTAAISLKFIAGYILNLNSLFDLSQTNYFYMVVIIRPSFVLSTDGRKTDDRIV